MGDEAVRNLLEYISRLLTSLDDDLVAGAKDELQMLRNELWLLQDYLRQAAMKELDLVRQVKEVCYEVEDTLESWSIQTVKINFFTDAVYDVYTRQFPMLRNVITRLYPPSSEVGNRLAGEIKSIREGRLEPLCRRIQAYAEKRPSKGNQVHSTQPNSDKVPFIELKNIFKDEADILISYLMEATEEPDVLSITGMPGIGKTTLARKIYESETVMSEFPTRIWVDIPLDFNSKDLYRNILEQYISLGNPQESSSNDSYIEIVNEDAKIDRINDGKIIHAIRDCLQKRRFLIVMDGVWNADTLESIMHFLPKNGKVLITSSNNHVTRKPHVLRFLTENEGWELLQLGVFGKLDECPEILKSTGECIAKNCDGSPLAIAVIANSLMVPSSTEAGKDLTKKWWKKVSVNLTMCITDYSVHYNVYESLELSYIKLPQYLQDCFLYLGVFPEGHEIPVWTLTRLWIAEGFIRDNGRLSSEESAERNLYDLIDRNLVIVGKIYPSGQIKTCRLHQLVYGFCKYKAAEQDFYQEIRMSQGGSLDHPNNRRLCIHSHLSRFLCSGPKALSVRSILCFSKEDKVLQLEHCSTIHRSFKLLKILECRCINFSKFPTKLTELMLLRYISLSCESLKVIPKAITSLCYLETLVVDTKSPSVKLEANIWRMLKLQHLVTKAAIVVAIRGTGEAGENLQTLTRLAPEWCTDDVLGRAPNLKTLGILGHLAALSSPESLRKLERLENLKLIHESAAADCQWQDRLIASNCFPPNLKRLTLSATNLDWERMSVLGKIASLEILKLKNNAFKGESWIHTDAGGFPRLGFLLIGTTDLVSWEPSADCFPSLKCLVLKNCERLHKIPATLAKSLDCLEVENISESAVESAKEIEQQQNRKLHEFKLSIRHGSE